MCLILFSFRQHEQYPLVVIANRDEFYERPSREAHWWEDNRHIFAGRDLRARGTWLGVTRTGRFAAITNVREPARQVITSHSRGDITRDYLQSSDTPVDFLQGLQARATQYAGFNLLVGDQQGLWFYSNRQPGIHELSPGTYGICNGHFDEPWPKLEDGKKAFTRQMQDSFNHQQLLAVLLNTHTYADHQLPDTGVPVEWERLLSSRFIQSEDYGTRAATVLTFDDRGCVDFREQNFTRHGVATHGISQQFTIDQTGEYNSG